MRRFPALVFGVVLSLYAIGAASGDFKKGWAAYNSLDYATAKAEWQQPADAGDANCAYGMGLLYGNGFGVDMNDELALKYYGIAAEQGHGDAAFNLAVMHQNGWGVPMDEKTANEWYVVAAGKGNTEAQMALGRYFAMDFLDTYDPVEAYKWFSLADRLGDFDAKDKSNFIASRMTPEQVAKGDALVEAWVAEHKDMIAKLLAD
jgi:TPR repeat protein